MKVISTLLLFGLLAISCQEHDTLEESSPTDPKSIAQEILSSSIYQEYTEVAKEIQLVMLYDVRERENVLDVNKLAGLEKASDKVAYLKESGYQSASRLHSLIERSDALSKSLLDLFNDIQGRVGLENFQNGLTYIDDHASQSYKITAQEALNFKQ